MRVLETLNRIFFAMALVLCGAACAHHMVNKSKNASGKIQKIAYSNDMKSDPDQTAAEEKNAHAVKGAGMFYRVTLAAVAAVGLFIRLWQFGRVPGGFNQDGAMAAVDGLALGSYATDRFGTFMPAHLYAWGDGQMSALLSYMIAPLTVLFGLNPITARLPLLFASVCGAVFFYIFIKDLFGKKTALAAAAVVAINPWHFVQSRWALDCNLFPHFFMGGICFLNKGLMKKRRYLFISMVFFGLCMYCYGIALYTVPLFLLMAAAYYCIKKRLKLTDVFISAGIYLLIAWPFLLTMAVNFFKWDTIRLPFVTIQYFPASVRSRDILFFSEQPLRQMLFNIKFFLYATLLQKRDLPWNDIEGFGTMYLFSMPFAALGVYRLIKSKTDSPRGLICIALIMGFAAGLFTNRVNVNRINIIYYFIMALLVLGIDFVLTEIKQTRVVLIGMYAVIGVLMVNTYFTSANDMIAREFYDGFGQALAYAQDSGAERIYVTADTQGKGTVAVSEILTLFYDKTDAKYFQGETNINHGKKCLPYRERFKYVSMTPDTEEETMNEDAAYLILVSDLEFFDEEKYDVQTFHQYCALVKKYT